MLLLVLTVAMCMDRNAYAFLQNPLVFHTVPSQRMRASPKASSFMSLAATVATEERTPKSPLIQMTQSQPRSRQGKSSPPPNQYRLLGLEERQEEMERVFALERNLFSKRSNHSNNNNETSTTTTASEQENDEAWVASCLEVLQGWAQLGEGRTAQAFHDRILFQNKNQWDLPLQQPIQMQQLVVHAWCNTVTRLLKSASEPVQHNNLQSIASAADQALQRLVSMTTNNTATTNEGTVMSNMTGNTTHTSMLSRHEFCAVVTAFVDSKDVTNAVRVLRQMEDQYLNNPSLYHDPNNWAHDPRIYLKVLSAVPHNSNYYVPPLSASLLPEDPTEGESSPHKDQLRGALLAEDIVEHMEQVFYHKSTPTKYPRPRVNLYNSILNAWSLNHSPSTNSRKVMSHGMIHPRNQWPLAARSAQKWLDRMSPKQNTFPRPYPNVRSYTLLMYTFCRCNMVEEAYQVFETLVDMLLEPPQVEKNGAKVPLWASRSYLFCEGVDMKSFKFLLRTLANVNRLTQQQQSNNNSATPTTTTTTRYVVQMSNVLEGMRKLSRAGYEKLTPDVFAYTTVITAWADCPVPESSVRAQKLLVELEDTHRSVLDETNIYPSNVPIRPDVAVYNAAVAAVAKRHPDNPLDAAKSIIQRMEAQYESGENTNVQPDAITYTTLIDAHLKRTENSVQEAEDILMDMIQQYKDGTNTKLKPSARAFVIVIDAWIQRKKTKDLTKAEALLEIMKEFYPVDIRRYERLIEEYCKKIDTNSLDTVSERNAAEKAFELLLKIEDQCQKETSAQSSLQIIKPKVSTYAAVISGWTVCATQNFNDTATVAVDRIERIRALRDEMYPRAFLIQAEKESKLIQKVSFSSINEIFDLISLLPKDDKSVQTANNIPANTLGLNLVLANLAKSGQTWVGQRAEDVLDFMIDQYLTARNSDLKPDTITVNTVLDAWARTPKFDAANRAETVLLKVSALQSKGLLTDLKLDRISYNTVIFAYAKSTGSDAASQAERLLMNMEDTYTRTGDPDLKPDVVSFSTVIHAYAKRGEGRRAEAILKRMHEEHKADPTKPKPNTRCFNEVLNAWSKSVDSGAGKRAEMILKMMEDSSADGQGDVLPATDTFNIVINTIGKSRDRNCAQRAQLLLDRMDQAYSNGIERLKPDTITFNTVLACWARSRGPKAANIATALLSRMYELRESGDKSVMPDGYSYTSVLTAIAYSGQRGSAPLAEGIIEEMVQKLSEGVIDFLPDTRIYNALINVWAKSGEWGAGQRANEIVQYMEDQYRGGTNVRLKPDIITYSTLLDTISRSREKGAAEQAEEVLTYMEDMYRSGDTSLRPDIRAYNSVINTWARSRESNKAVRAQAILRRMEAQSERTPMISPHAVYCYNSVLNACAYTNGDEEDLEEAFKVACITFDELRVSRHYKPSHVTYGTMLGVCTSLMPKGETRNNLVEALFQRCIKDGQVGDMVIQRLGDAAPENLYQKLLNGQSAVNLPQSWSCNVRER